MTNFLLCEFRLNKNTWKKIKNRSIKKSTNAGICLSSCGWREGTHFFPTLGRDDVVGDLCLRALGMVSTNLSAPWGPCSGWRERRALKEVCQGFEREPGFFSRSRAVLGLLFSAISGPRVSRKHGQVGLPASRREEAL